MAFWTFIKLTISYNGEFTSRIIKCVINGFVRCVGARSLNVAVLEPRRRARYNMPRYILELQSA